MTNMYRLLHIEQFGQRRQVVGVGIHLVATPGLLTAPVAPPVVAIVRYPCEDKNSIWSSNASDVSAIHG